MGLAFRCIRSVATFTSSLGFVISLSAVVAFAVAVAVDVAVAVAVAVNSIARAVVSSGG
jgi:hypothetical protein